MCRQARAHLRGTALTYVKRAPFQPRSWEELNALLVKRHQPRDLTATFKAQFCSMCRRHNEDIHTYVKALQRLANMAWPFMDGQAKEELVVDQFLMGMESHELSVQVAAHGHCHMEDMLHVARSLEAVHEEERHAPHSRKPAAQTRFVVNGHPDTTDTERVVQEVLAQMGHDLQRNQGRRHRKLTPGPKRVQSVERKDIKPASRTPSRERQRGCSPSTESQSLSRGEPAQCFRCKGFGHFAKDCPSEGFYKVGPNSLPVRVWDPSRDSSQDSQQAKDKATTKQSLN